MKNQSVVETLLRLSRLPQKNPKSFDNFDFSRIHGKSVEHLKNLPALTAIHAHKNLAFIGPHGVGKTHLACAYGRACCEKKMKAYFLKASELNERLTDARRLDRTGSMIDFLVKPSCLIIDEIGRCVFDKENTRLFFDLIDRRYSREGANCMIFTSNMQPDTWSDFFTEDSSLLCALDSLDHMYSRASNTFFHSQIQILHLLCYNTLGGEERSLSLSCDTNLSPWEHIASKQQNNTNNDPVHIPFRHTDPSLLFRVRHMLDKYLCKGLVVKIFRVIRGKTEGIYVSARGTRKNHHAGVRRVRVSPDRPGNAVDLFRCNLINKRNI